MATVFDAPVSADSASELDDANRQAANALGADDFITKPVDFKVLRERMLQLYNV